MEPLFFQALEPFFKAAGFALIRHKNQFRKETSNGFQNVILAVSPVGNESWLEINIGARLEMVEKTAYPFTYGLSGFSGDSNTVITSIGRLQGKNHFRYKAAAESDVEHISLQVADFMEVTGFDFLDQASRFSVVHQWLNAHPLEPCPYVYNQFYRCLRGVTLASIAAPPELDAIAALHRQALENLHAPADTHLRYERLVQFLRTFSFN